mgnify:CR=1 FL=1
MYTKEDGVYFCKKLRVLEFLTAKGLKPFAEKQDMFNPKFSIWIFKNSPELYETVEEYYAKIPKQN